MRYEDTRRPMPSRYERRVKRRQKILLTVGLVLCAVAIVAMIAAVVILTRAVAPALEELFFPDSVPVASEASVPAPTAYPVPMDTLPVVQVEETADPAPAAQETAPRYIPDIPLDAELQEVLWTACNEYGVPAALALAVMEKESSFDIDADNGRCVGLMQINSVNFDWLLDRGIDARTPAGNIQAGCCILGGHLDKYGDQHKALMAYNCGAAGAARLWERGYTSSKYSRAVVEAAENWQSVIDDYQK